MTRTTSTGTTITLEQYGADLAVIFANPNAPADLRRTEAGRVIDGGFQPAPFAAFGMSPEALRIIATLIEDQT